MREGGGKEEGKRGGKEEGRRGEGQEEEGRRGGGGARRRKGGGEPEEMPKPETNPPRKGVMKDVVLRVMEVTSTGRRKRSPLLERTFQCFQRRVHTGGRQGKWCFYRRGTTTITIQTGFRL